MPGTPAFDGLAVGDIVAEQSFPLTRDSLVRYAGASGDFNAIHYRDDIAHAVGLPGVLAHGMLTMGFAVQPVVDWVGDPGRVVDYQVRFTRPVVVDPKLGAVVSGADVVVIGGGIIGVFTAYYLARRGLSVAVVEKGRIGAEQSSRNWGWCRQQNRDARELPMATRSLELWAQFAADTGEDTGFSRCGLLYLSDDEFELERWARWRDFARTAGVTTHMLSGRQASQRGQATGRAWKGGVFSPSDGTADPATTACRR